MNCKDVHRNFVAAKYVSASLPEDIRETFEQHYFACDLCFAEVEALQAAKYALSGRAAAAPPKSLRLLWALPLAAALLAGLFLRAHNKVEAPALARVTVAQPPSADSSAVARFEPPPWAELRFRSRSTPVSVPVERARSLYAAHNYAGCAEALQAAQQSPANLYHTGICLVLAGRTNDGATALRDTIAAGDTPFLEEAHFYLARSLLLNHAAAEARKELAKVVAMHGDLETSAHDLLESLR
jgi:hypothetical protein